MANANTLLAPAPKDRTLTTTDPVKEAAQPPGAAAADRHSRTAQSTPANADVAARAYEYWQERGCPDGSPEVDWQRAEADLRLSAT